MIRRPWLGVALSLSLHAGLLALVIVTFARDERLPALMIDLREPFVPGSASVASPPREQPPARPASTARSTRSRSRPGKTTAEPAATAPTPPPPPSPGPPVAHVVEAPPPPPPPAPAPAAPAPAAPAPAAPAAGAEPAPSAPTSRASGGPSPIVGATTVEPAARPGGGGTAASAAAAATGERGGTSVGSTAADPRASGRADASGPSGPRVASVPPGAAGSGAGAEYGPYLAALRQRIQQSVRYPASARRRGLAGTVSVEILIMANGTIGDVTLLESSTHAVLDDAALDTIRALPRVPLPPELPARPLRVRVPVVFEMR